MTTADAIQTVVETIKNEYRPERIVLFGSRVWGRAQRDSDLDILIIKQSRKSEAERIREVSRLVRPRPLPLDILVKTPAEIRRRLEQGDDFLAEILQRGKVAYERRANPRVDRKGRRRLPSSAGA